MGVLLLGVAVVVGGCIVVGCVAVVVGGCIVVGVSECVSVGVSTQYCCFTNCIPGTTSNDNTKVK